MVWFALFLFTVGNAEPQGRNLPLNLCTELLVLVKLRGKQLLKPCGCEFTMLVDVAHRPTIRFAELQKNIGGSPNLLMKVLDVELQCFLDLFRNWKLVPKIAEPIGSTIVLVRSYSPAAHIVAVLSFSEPFN